MPVFATSMNCTWAHLSHRCCSSEDVTNECQKPNPSERIPDTDLGKLGTMDHFLKSLPCKVFNRLCEFTFLTSPWCPWRRCRCLSCPPGTFIIFPVQRIRPFTSTSKHIHLKFHFGMLLLSSPLISSKYFSLCYMKLFHIAYLLFKGKNDHLSWQFGGSGL